MKRTTISLESEDHDKIKKIADENDISFSKMIRSFIRHTETLYTLLEELGLGQTPPKLIQPKIKEINDFMEEWKNADNLE